MAGPAILKARKTMQEFPKMLYPNGPGTKGVKVHSLEEEAKVLATAASEEPVSEQREVQEDATGDNQNKQADAEVSGKKKKGKK